MRCLCQETAIWKNHTQSEKCVFIGYPKETIGHTFYHQSEGKVFVARNGSFLEKEFLSKEVNNRKVELKEVVEPSLHGMVIRCKHIYNFWCSMLVYCQLLYVLLVLLGVFIWFPVTNILTRCQSASSCFLHRRKSISDGVKMPRNFTEIFYGPEGTC